MERVAVIGCVGSGKSTLARQLASRTGLAVVERDALGEEGSPGYLPRSSDAAHQLRVALICNYSPGDGGL